jgi:uncharacterized protein YpuA (DUF1002 family)
MPKLQSDQLKAIHAVADEKEKIRLETLRHTTKLDKWLFDTICYTEPNITTDEQIQLAIDIKYMQDGDCNIDFIANTLQRSSNEIRWMIRHTEEMKRNMGRQNK